MFHVLYSPRPFTGEGLGERAGVWGRSPQSSYQRRLVSSQYKNPAQRTKSGVVSLREACFWGWIPTFVGMTGFWECVGMTGFCRCEFIRTVFGKIAKNQPRANKFSPTTGVV
jgi:hypothetical protein